MSDLAIPGGSGQTPDDSDSSERRRLAALAESALRFRRQLQDAADTLTVDMIKDNDDVSAIAFHTPNGRTCVMVLAIGDDACNYVVNKLKENLADEAE